MTAGRGIVHSERTPADVRTGGAKLFGLQIWVALPSVHEETDPSFAHYEEADLPFSVMRASACAWWPARPGGSGLQARSRLQVTVSRPGQLLVLRPGDAIAVRNAGEKPAGFVLVGGQTMDGPRHIWWNFVSSRPERIEQAKAEWKAGRFDTVSGDAEEFIPLPEMVPVVRDAKRNDTVLDFPGTAPCNSQLCFEGGPFIVAGAATGKASWRKSGTPSI